ncbi:MAG: 3-dehydroquinate synthase [Anaerolineales bacterium]|nr:3-dehydroquinate synthase [Anaerolineales bacterium]
MSPGVSRDLILTGFMGTGKTSIGRMLAKRLNRRFLDMDTEIERRAGNTIPQIFIKNGEAAFRRMETSIIEELVSRSGKPPMVISTGGGALVDYENRRKMIQSGTVVCLSASPAEIMSRTNPGASGDRPLLNNSNPREEIERLLADRKRAYTSIPWQVDTNDLTQEQVVQRVLEYVDVVSLPVRYPTGEYPIHVGNGLLAHVGEAISATGAVQAGTRTAVVSNPVVAPLYWPKVENSLSAAGLDPFLCLIPDGEQHKTLATVAGLYDRFLEGELDRSGVVVALGGGVTGDIAGFAAATFLRGVGLVQIPTTLLSMVDSSVGGKTGVDMEQGKNLVGAFKQPECVVIDPQVLKTLAPVEYRSGVAETIKHGVIGDSELFDRMERIGQMLDGPYELGVPEIVRAVNVKIRVVESDPFEKGLRAVLNLGHTLGHALEKLSDYSLRHGEGVAIGMVAAGRIAVEMGMLDTATAGRIRTALETWGLPVCCPATEMETIWKVMARDKKRRGRTLNWILPRGISEVEIRSDVARGIVESVLHSMITVE